MEIIHFESLGCKLNQIEIEAIAQAFAKAGFNPDISREVAHDEPLPTSKISLEQNVAPLFTILNTCTVTGKAEQKARRLIRLLLKKHSSAPVLVTGCYAEVEQQFIASLDPRVVVLPGSLKNSLVLLPQFLLHRQIVLPEEPIIESLCAFVAFAQDEQKSSAEDHLHNSLLSTKPKDFALSTDTFIAHSRASVKIQDGCNNKCSYCRIRLARGKAVSLPITEVIKTIQKIEAAGWNEVVLTGVNLSQYSDGSKNFADLLALILKNTKNIAIRISSLYPERINEELAPLLAHKRIRPHFHISVQSGSDTILKSMRRPYTAETVGKAVRILRKVKDNPFIACDIIAGYPGETDADFEQTLALCTELNFASIHAFPFSARPGTEAWDLKPKIPERVTKERVAQLISLSNTNKQNYERSWIGKPLKAIIEHSEKDGVLRLLTENYISCSLDTSRKDAAGAEKALGFKQYIPGSEISIILETQNTASFV